MNRKKFLSISKYELIVFILLFSVILSIFSNIKFEGFRTDVLGGDARGYYAWLPTVFIHQTLDFREVHEQQKKLHGEHYQGHYYSDFEGSLINKYTVGTALLLAPFFLMAMLLSYLLGFPVDGYSFFFQLSIVAGGLFYTLLGLFFTFKLLRSFGFDRKTSTMALFFYLFATNLFYYGFMHPGMSHIYSFAMASGLLYYSRRFFLNHRNAELLWASVGLGLTLLIRPFNVFIILLLPFMAENTGIFIHSLKKVFGSTGKLFLMIFPALLIIGIQALIYACQTGHLWVWSYPGEGFNFDEPRILDVLFSYRKGLFVYTPLLFISLLGFIPLFRKNAFRGFVGLTFLLILTYFISSWWNWFYGDSFGMRPYIDFYVLFILLFAYLYREAGKAVRKFILHPVLILLMLLNLVQSYQYHHGIMHRDAMSKEKYWYIFMKTGSEYENILGDTQEALFKESPLQALDTFNISFDSIPENWDIIDTLLIENPLDSNDIVYLMDSAITYSSTFILKDDTTIFGHQELWSQVSLHYYELDTNAALKSMLVTSVRDNNGTTFFYKSLRIKDYPDDTIQVWKTKELGYRINLPEKTDELRVYLWNPKDVSFLIDDINIKLHSISEDAEFSRDQDLK